MIEKKISDPEFAGYQAMMALPRQPNYWIYFSPDNRFAILVDVATGDVLYSMNRSTFERTYENPKAKKAIVKKTLVVPKLYLDSIERRIGRKLEPRDVA